MMKKSIKVFTFLVLFWIVTLVTVIRELSRRNIKVKYKNAEEQSKVYDDSLTQFRKKYNISLKLKPERSIWQKLKPVNQSLSFEEKLELVKGVDYPLGYDGRAVVLKEDLKSTIMMKIKKGWTIFGFNVFVSDLLPLDRSLLDVRSKWCRKQNYTGQLPQVSIVITFHNEPWSTLMRTVHSVLKMTPNLLLKQIILFDDSSNPHINPTLEDDIRRLPKITLVRSSKHRGVMVARVAALSFVTTSVVVFLDSHCECTKGWLEPLLDRITEDSTRIASPVIDEIHSNTFEYITYDAFNIRIGGFNWNLEFIWRGIPGDIFYSRKNPAEPLQTPTISGGIFAVNLEYFKELGLYDPEFRLLGAENLELSFKTWMCGGSLEIIPCSHVGHVLKKKVSFRGLEAKLEEASTWNKIRVAEVWLDDYKKFFYQRIENKQRNFGDVSDRLKLRESLHCKSFQWYLQNVYKNMVLPDTFVASGQIESMVYDNMCLGTNLGFYKETLTLEKCQRSKNNQFWAYTSDGQMKYDEMCLDYEADGSRVWICVCRGRVLSQTWLYENKTNYIRNMGNQKCLRILRDQEGTNKLVLEECTNSLSIRWILQNYDVEKLSPTLQIYAKREVGVPNTEKKRKTVIGFK